MSAIVTTEVCSLCGEILDDGQPTVCLGKKGSDSINKASTSKGGDLKTVIGQSVHTDCRRDYIHKRTLTKQAHVTTKVSPVKARRSSDSFEYRQHCIFCTQHAKLNSRKRGSDVYPVRSTDFQNAIESICKDRKDRWANQVLGRLKYAIDLPAADAVYHQSCNVNFRTYKNIPKKFQGKERKIEESLKSPGRPVNHEQKEAFSAIIEYVKSCDDQVVTVSDLVNKMKEKCGDQAYSTKYMKTKLTEHFGPSIIISQTDGKSDKITLKVTASSVINEFYLRPKNQSPEEEKLKIIETAAKLIKNNIQSVNNEKSSYPAPLSVSSVNENINFLPKSLQTLLEIVFTEKEKSCKLVAIGQAIMQACRPRALIAPLQLGLGVQMHHHFGSKFLIDTLSNLGFSSSYWEVQKYESSAAATLKVQLPDYFPGQFLQFVADNVDHNIRTLDGHNTFHGMGIIGCSTPATPANINIPRLNVQSKDLNEIGTISLKYYKVPDQEVSSLLFKELPVAGRHNEEYVKTDLLSKVVWPLRSSRPSWSGFMQLYHKDGEFPGKSTITFLPMIDMNPSDHSCINSTLHFVCEQSGEYGVTPVVTFDQPLFWKATTIINNSSVTSPLQKIVLRLGGFHTEMSFLGSIGHLMMGSGLQELLETVYAPNAVTHMLTGKAVARAIRGHFLADTALHAILLSKVFNIPLPEQSTSLNEGSEHAMTEDSLDNFSEEETGQPITANDDKIYNSMINDVVQMYDNLAEGEMPLKEICSSDQLHKIHEQLCKEKETLKVSRTAALWLQYLDMISILKDFIRSERTGDWQQHLMAVRKMLPYFAASGHNLYLKSAYIYLQNMLKLPTDHPAVYQAFMSGNHVVRRTDRFWAGLSTDLVIEQALMRSVKSTGGMTRGRGMSELQRTVWLLSMPACAEMNTAMQQLTSVDFNTSEQHKEVGKTRAARDEKDTLSFLSYLQQRNPFQAAEDDKSLRNIETGVTADDTVNVETANEIGTKTLRDMIGKNTVELSFKKSQQAVTLNVKTSVKVSGEIVAVDPQLLFQRLTTAANRYVSDLSEVFRYELSGVPSSLFDSMGLMREPQKSALAQAIWSYGDCSATESRQPTENIQYVIDGGSLLQRIPWEKGSTFGEICNKYLQYLNQKYVHITVVFDGYASGPSTKDVALFRRSKGNTGANVKFSSNTPFKMKKEVFLSNTQNKQKFICLLGEVLAENGLTVKYADADADLLIVTTAVESANEVETHLIGEDTDLLVLLCYYMKQDSQKLTFRSESRQSIVKPKVWDIQKTKTVLGEDTCKLLPLIHALTGCDTTSRIFGISKPAVLKTLLKDRRFRALSFAFLNAGSKAEIIKSGENLITHLFGGLSLEGLDLLRFRKFASKVMASSSCVQVHTLPPTSAAAAFHSQRVHLQVQTWAGNNSIVPEDWGWELAGDSLQPIKTDLPPAPEKLLQIIRCNCKHNCDTKRCSCRKHGLDCSVGCGECRGVSCSNSAGLADIGLEENY